MVGLCGPVHLNLVRMSPSMIDEDSLVKRGGLGLHRGILTTMNALLMLLWW